MNYTKTEQKLMNAMARMDIIDSHEHLPPENVRTSSPQDLFTLFSHYTKCDLISAGMDRSVWRGDTGWSWREKEYEGLFDYTLPLENRWKSFKPYWEQIRYGSYARAALLTAKMVYGVEDINDETYQVLSERISAENTPGIYRRILVDRCRIRASLSLSNSTDVERPLVPLMPSRIVTDFSSRDQIDPRFDGFSENLGVTIKNLDDCLEAIRRQLETWASGGCVGIKIRWNFNLPPDRASADEAFRKFFNGDRLVAASNNFEPLRNFLTHHVIDMSAELGLVLAVHAGMWSDFRDIDCKHMLTLAPAHPQANFDLYHLGMPSVRDCIVIGKNFPNVFLNLCWCHIISQAQTCSGIDELLDQVPVNKVLAFGGDYGRPVEKVVGHLHMARENFARVFSARIDRGLMDFDEAVHILKLWFWENPLALYRRLKVEI